MFRHRLSGAPRARRSPWRLVMALLTLGILLLAAMQIQRGGASGHPVLEGDLYYTKYSGSPRVKKVSFTYDGSSFTLGTPQMVANTAGADGIQFAPDGDLIVGGQGNRVYKINPDSGAVTYRDAGGTQSFHLALDPSGVKAWSAGIPGALAEIPLSPFANGIRRPLTGHDTAITSVAFDPDGNAYYTRSGSGGHGMVGKIDLTTFTTTRFLSSIPAAHGMAYDSYTGHLMLFGSNHVTQIDPATMTIVADRAFSGVAFDQGTVDGQGHMYVASNNGQLFFMDYAASGRVDAAGNFVSIQFLDSYLDDVAPLTGPGAPVQEIRLEIAGGATQPVGTTATVTVTAVDMAGTGVAGVPLTLDVSGVHPAAFTGTTDGDGTAIFSYAGTVAGDDTLVASGSGTSSDPTLVHWISCTASPSLTWKTPLSGSTPYDMAAGSAVDIRFSYGDCAGFVRDESVIILVQDPTTPDYPLTAWVYGSDIAIDDRAAEYQQRFNSSLYNVTPGQTLKVLVYINYQPVGEAMINVIP